MSLIAELTLTGDPLLFGDLFDHVPEARCQFEDIHYVIDEGVTHYVFCWWVTLSDAGFATFERGLEAEPTVDGFRVLTPIEERRLYRVVTTSFPPEQFLVFPLFRELGVTALESRRDADGPHLKARVPDRDALREFSDSARDIVDTVELTRVFEERTTDVPSPLTEKQHATVCYALEHGYFEIPRRVSTQEIADEFDLSQQAITERLRRGIQRLATELCATVGQTR